MKLEDLICSNLISPFTTIFISYNFNVIYEGLCVESFFNNKIDSKYLKMEIYRIKIYKSEEPILCIFLKEPGGDK